MSRFIRYQGAIVQDHHILLIQHTHHDDGRSYWLIPGGGIEEAETEEACVAREMWEETGLRVVVERLLLDDVAEPESDYQRHKTYLCMIKSGKAAPGHEPESDAAAAYAITAVGWFDLRDAESWPPEIVRNHFIFPLLLRLQVALGYSAQRTDPKH